MGALHSRASDNEDSKQLSGYALLHQHAEVAFAQEQGDVAGCL